MFRLMLGTVLLLNQCVHIASAKGNSSGAQINSRHQRASYESIESCYWNIYNPCELVCMAGESDQLAHIVEQYYERTVCMLFSS